MTVLVLGCAVRTGPGQSGRPTYGRRWDLWSSDAVRGRLDSGQALISLASVRTASGERHLARNVGSCSRPIPAEAQHQGCRTRTHSSTAGAVTHRAGRCSPPRSRSECRPRWWPAPMPARTTLAGSMQGRRRRRCRPAICTSRSPRTGSSTPGSMWASAARFTAGSRARSRSRTASRAMRRRTSRRKRSALPGT